MGNNNYQFRLQSLDVLDQYVAKLKQEAEQILVYPMNLKNYHESFSDSDSWNDIRHTEFFEGPINEIIIEASKLNATIEEAVNRLNELKSMYANSGVR